MVCVYYFQIRETTKSCFPSLTIQQFGSLFKAFKIFPAKMVEEFLGFYVIQPGLKIGDPTWHMFVSEIVVRFGGARNHFFLLDFLKAVAAGYLSDKRQQEFVVDLLQLKVPKLFAVEEGADGPEAAEKEDTEVARRFSVFLRAYINRNALKHSILNQMSTLLVCLIVGMHVYMYIHDIVHMHVHGIYRYLIGYNTTMLQCKLNIYVRYVYCCINIALYLHVHVHVHVHVLMHCTCTFTCRKPSLKSVMTSSSSYWVCSRRRSSQSSKYFRVSTLQQAPTSRPYSRQLSTPSAKTCPGSKISRRSRSSAGV